jgi:hypothetical protein
MCPIIEEKSLDVFLAENDCRAYVSKCTGEKYYLHRMANIVEAS